MQHNSRQPVPVTHVGGWPHVALSRKAFAQLMVDDCLELRASQDKMLPKLAFSMNGQALSLAEENNAFSNAMSKADYIQADGQSLVIASRFLAKTALPERIATTDFFHDAAEAAAKHGLSFYILGAAEYQHKLAIENIRQQYPTLKIAGHRNGYFKEEDEEEVCKAITQSGADVLWIGLGKPKEQLFCIRNIDRLRGIGWIKTCGGLFDFLSGKNIRAPMWMQSTGLEWLHRMLLDPRRLFWRYFVTNIHAIFILIRRDKHPTQACDSEITDSKL